MQEYFSTNPSDSNPSRIEAFTRISYVINDVLGIGIKRTVIYVHGGFLFIVIESMKVTKTLHVPFNTLHLPFKTNQ